MKQMSNIAVAINDACLTMQGYPAPAKLSLCSSLLEERVHRLPHQENGEWIDEVVRLSWEGALDDMLCTDELEGIKCEVYDGADALQGEALIAFRSNFSFETSEMQFRTPVTYLTNGIVGELAGTLRYSDLPRFCQMPTGVILDKGEIENPSICLEGQILPPTCPSAPVWTPAESEKTNDPEDDETPTTNDDTRPSCETPPLTTASLGEAANVTPREPRLKQILPKHGYDFETKGYQPLIEDDLAENLPPNWTARRDRVSGRRYFIDGISKRATWIDPRYLPENWDQRVNDKGDVVYAYHKTSKVGNLDPRGMASGWSMRLSQEGKAYFVYGPTRKSCFNDPRGLCPGVEAKLDKLGRMYFIRHDTQTTAWEDPREDTSPTIRSEWLRKEYSEWWREQVTKTLTEEQEDDEPVDNDSFEISRQ